MTETMFQSRKKTDEVLKTITLSGRDLRAAARLLELLSGLEVDRARFGETDQTTCEPTLQIRARLVERARRAFRNRQRRSKFFSNAMFGEPAWDMLLALYVTERSDARYTIVKLMAHSGAPATTALRWLDYLENDRLVSRRPNPIDKRTSFVELTDKARTALDAYFSGTIATDTID